MRADCPLTARDVELSVAAATKVLRQEIAKLAAENAEYRKELNGKDGLIDKLYAEIATLQKELEIANERAANPGMPI